MNPVELTAQIRQTAAFIAVDPVPLVLTPHGRQADGSGGHRLVAEAPRPSQTFRIIDNTSQATRPTDTGEQWTQGVTVLGMPDAVVEPEDTFDFAGSTWKVTELLFPLAYEVRALAVRHGR